MKKRESKTENPKPESDKTYTGRQRKVGSKRNENKEPSPFHNRKTTLDKSKETDTGFRQKVSRKNASSNEVGKKETEFKKNVGKFNNEGPKRKSGSTFKKSYSPADSTVRNSKSSATSSYKRKESSDSGFRKDNRKGRVHRSDSGFEIKSEDKKKSDSGFDKRNEKSSDKKSFRNAPPVNTKSQSDEGFREDKRTNRSLKQGTDFKRDQNYTDKINKRKAEEVKPFNPRAASRKTYDKPKRNELDNTGFRKGRRGKDTNSESNASAKKETESVKIPRKFNTDKGGLKAAPTYKSLAGESKKKGSLLNETEEIRLNRFIANAGVCSRREADELITQGLIRVNNKVVTEMGFKVKPADVIKYNNKVLKQEKFVYVLLNKPKDFITTTEDPEARKTVMELVKNACEERIYPVGRLDRNTTGLLLFTNDGELADKLSHPSNKIRKVYQVEINKPITDEDVEKIKNGIELEDGKATVDDLAIITPDAMVVGIEIHLGRNRIVRRIFEKLGYDVLKLDRVTYASLTKKDLSRGNWRYLTEKEVINLKHFTK